MGTPPETVPHSLQASIIPLPGSNHKPLYVKTLSFAAYPPAFLVPWCYNPISLAGRYLNPPSQDWRPGFSLVDYPAGGPGPIGVGLCRNSWNFSLATVQRYARWGMRGPWGGV